MDYRVAAGAKPKAQREQRPPGFIKAQITTATGYTWTLLAKLAHEQQDQAQPAALI